MADMVAGQRCSQVCGDQGKISSNWGMVYGIAIPTLEQTKTGWWLGFNPSEKYQSIGMIIPSVWENKRCSSHHQPENQWCHQHSLQSAPSPLRDSRDSVSLDSNKRWSSRSTTAMMLFRKTQPMPCQFSAGSWVTYITSAVWKNRRPKICTIRCADV